MSVTFSQNPDGSPHWVIMEGQGDEGPVMAQHPDGWSKLYLPALPDFPSGGNGWVANDHLRFVIEK